MALNAVTARVGLDARGYEKGSKRVRDSNKRFNKSMNDARESVNKVTSALGGYAAGLAAIVSVGAVTTATNEVITQGAEFSKLARDIGLAANQLQSFQVASSLAGLDIQGTNDLLKALTIQLVQFRQGTGGFIEASERTGGALGEILNNARDTSEQLEVLVGWLQTASIENRNFALSVTVGDTGTFQTLGVLEQLDRAQQLINTRGIGLTREDAQGLEDVRTSIQELVVVMSGAFTKAVAQNTEVIGKLVDRVDNFASDGLPSLIKGTAETAEVLTGFNNTLLTTVAGTALFGSGLNRMIGQLLVFAGVTGEAAKASIGLVDGVLNVVRTAGRATLIVGKFALGLAGIAAIIVGLVQAGGGLRDFLKLLDSLISVVTEAVSWVGRLVVDFYNWATSIGETDDELKGLNETMEESFSLFGSLSDNINDLLDIRENEAILDLQEDIATLKEELKDFESFSGSGAFGRSVREAAERTRAEIGVLERRLQVLQGFTRLSAYANPLRGLQFAPASPGAVTSAGVGDQPVATGGAAEPTATELALRSRFNVGQAPLSTSINQRLSASGVILQQQAEHIDYIETQAESVTDIYKQWTDEAKERFSTENRYRDLLSDLTIAAENGARNFGNIIEGALMGSIDLMGNLRALAYEFVLDLQRAFVVEPLQGVAQQLLTAGVSAIGGAFLPSPTAGGVRPEQFAFGRRAGGGSVMAGNPYLVGERGVEAFIPSTAGTIIPNNRLGGGTVQNFVFNIEGDADAVKIQRAIQQATPGIVGQSVGAVAQATGKPGSTGRKLRGRA